MSKDRQENMSKSGVSCGMCRNPDDSRMVCCDDCGGWFHFECVGVDEGIEEVDWSCKSCEKRRTAQVSPTRLTVPVPTRTTKSPKGSQEQQNKLVMEFQKQMEQMQSRFQEQQLAYEKMLAEKDREMKNAMNDLQYQFQCQLEKREQQIRDEMVGQQVVPPPNANSTTVGNAATDMCQMMERVEKQLQKMAEVQKRDTMRLEERLRAMEISANNRASRSTSNVDVDSFDSNPGLSSATISHELSRSQLAARQAVAKELPEFSGNPEEWPLFIATYESTTKMCGFSDEENLLRLQRSLKGKALEAVRSRLLHPCGLEGVINTLRTLFGRPEIIVHSIVCKIREMPAPKTEKLETLIDFGVAVQNMCATIVACGLNEHLCNVALLQELVEKLPPTIKLDWAKYRQPLRVITLSDFSAWLGTLVEAACVVTVPSPISVYTGKPEKRNRKEELHVHLESSSTQTTSMMATPPKSHNKQCIICFGGCSTVEICKKFQEFDVGMRWAALKQNKLCRKCLTKHFGACMVKQTCGRNGCPYMHHKLLHDDYRYQRNENSPISTQHVETATSTETCNAHVSQAGQVLFRYVPVTLHGRGKTVRIFAFLDDGSSVTLMEHSLLQELELEGKSHPLCLGWTADQQRQEMNSVRLPLEISGVREATTHWLPKVHTVESLALPYQTLAMNELEQHYHYLKKLPIDSYHNVRPRMLIGMDNCRLGNALDSREGEKNEPIATRTRLGWTVFGPCAVVPKSNLAAHHSLHVCACCERNDLELHGAVKAYFSLDSLGVMNPIKPLLSKDDERAEQLLKALTHVKEKRYETGLLWRYNDTRLPDSKAMATRRLLCLEKRMQRDPELAKNLKQKIQDYERSGYVEKLTENQLSEVFPRVWYLPIFPVVNPNKPGKFRIVWDAAAKVSGVSLNSFLLTGPDLLNSLPSVLQRFREFRVAITGDIREMFHQVMINRNDQQCQRFLWRNGEQNRSPDVYAMKVMTFGANCSPSCAQYVKNHNALRFQKLFPRAAEAIVKEHYVDDMLSSEESEEDAVQLVKDVCHVHAEAGFEIRNWLSNSKQVLREVEAIPGEKSLNLSNEMGTEKVLGMWWCTNTDTFTFKVSPRISTELLQGNVIPSKRQVLSILMMIYDPLGLLAHFLMFLKILLQEIWRSGINWDDQIKSEQHKKWMTWLRVLPQVKNVSVPRCYRQKTGIEKRNVMQLHVFVDASENGFAAVAYLRFEENGQVECALIGAKTRVAPLRFVSIPRLELQSALIGARFANDIGETHKLKPSQRFFWTDSRDVLCWLNSDHRKYNQFVAVRVSELLELTDLNEWNWVPSKLNVADDATKWQQTPDLSPTSRWYRCPEFLWKLREQWPTSTFVFNKTLEDRRTHVLHHNAHRFPFQWEDFSEWQVLLRRVAFVKRYPANLRRKLIGKPIVTGPLTQLELREAEKLILKLVQESEFSSEITNLQKPNPIPWKKVLPKESSLYGLSPILGEDGLLRMNGRIDACEFIDKCTKRPVILPKRHPVTDLIIANIHRRYRHMNHQTVLNEVRRRFYVPRLRSTYRRVRTNCQICKNNQAKPSAPVMSNLPPTRLKAFCRPFSYVGIDYFGPMSVVVGRRSEKRWGVLITCLTVRAIHLEVAHSLTTDSCILAIRNFIARRGAPIEIISDRGTNFIGASRELREALKQVNQDRMMEHFTTTDTKWSFNPPASPHFGGAWERLVQSVKKAIKHTQLTRTPNDELLKNMLTEVEFIVNSRPLTELPLDNELSTALTPNHFLLGSSDGTKPPIAFDDSRYALKNTWTTSQVYANRFWRRWITEYLPSLTRRTKWFNHVKPIAEGDIVVIVDEALPRNCWPKGRVVRAIQSTDGQVRRALVRTATGVLERPTVKLAVLDVGESTGTSEK
ncbi:uncharacterized protein LOC131426502 [Malaya genurostris]|uniref:uncharacterized protein LOC131426502 n=1 Tax=Malaya genurostris TaxID=325434 RepID=UPI0026F40865|nr:uncharacterized protein LOC131426502 [Malaya genurostris]XP_058445268.1 uncharacterized protein LOC131426502 [Malaya genurostris]XP_058445269.1 uncharacterized protein LOC131426502 [Malaya genurostris]